MYTHMKKRYYSDVELSSQRHFQAMMFAKRICYFTGVRVRRRRRRRKGDGYGYGYAAIDTATNRV